MSDLGQILQVASRGSQLSISLYDFAATIPSATTDAAQLAKGTKDLARSLWQVGVSQKEDLRITTGEARAVVADIVQQCRLVFTEIDAVVPLDMIRDGTAISYGQNWEWNQVSRTKAQYLLGHLESLRLTLEVLSQAVKSVRVLEWSWSQPRNMVSNEAVTIDRLQLEGLVMEQQLALVRASQLFTAYQQATDNSDLHLITHSQNSQALTLFEDHAPNPRRLLCYQDTTVAESRFAQTETQQMALVRRTASEHIDFLLVRWTRLREIRKQQQPSVDSDDSSDEDVTPQPTYSNGLHSPMGPILTGIDEEADEEHHAVKSPDRSRPAMPIPHPKVAAQVPASPVAIPIARSWNAGSSTVLSAPPVRAPDPGTRSTPASPRASFSAAPKPIGLSPVASSTRSQPSESQERRIPWRLRVDHKIWDHENDKIVKRNCPEHPSQVKMGRHVATEILGSYISEEAIKEKGYRFDRYMTDVDDGRSTKRESLFSIRGPLTFEEVRGLVKRTDERYENRWKRPRPRPNLAHAATEPLPTPGNSYHLAPDDQRPSSRDWDDRRLRMNRSNTSSPNASGSEREPEYKPSSHRRRDSSTSTRASKDPKGNKAARDISKLAAGAGVFALLEGLGSL